MNNNKKKNNNSTYETLCHMRRDWGAINPITKIIPNKKKNKKNKYKKIIFEE